MLNISSKLYLQYIIEQVKNNSECADKYSSFYNWEFILNDCILKIEDK